MCCRLTTGHRLGGPDPFTISADQQPQAADQQLEAVIDELVLWQELDHDVMCEQIEHLTTLIDRGRLTLGIVPRHAPQILFTRVMEMWEPRFWLAAEEETTGVHYSGPSGRTANPRPRSRHRPGKPARPHTAPAA